MTKLLVCLFLLMASRYIWAAANDLVFTQRNSTDTGTFTRFPMVPSSTNGIFGFNVSTVLPEWWTLGPGLQVTGTTIDVAPSAGQVNSDWNSNSGVSQILNKPTNVSSFANDSGYLTGVNSSQVTSALGFTPYNATNPNSYINQSQARTSLSLTTTGTGAASYNNSTGVLNIPTPATQAPFNFSQPAAKTVNVNTSYQAADPTKAAIITPSYACQNATTVLAASGCTLQVRIGTGTLTCSTGTVVYTQSLTVQLGVLITQNSTNPVQINLPINGSFIVCPTTGTFTITAVEQSAG